MAYITGKIAVDSQNGYIKLTCGKAGNSIGGGNNIVIYKKSNDKGKNGTDWFCIVKKNVSVVNDLNFSFTDIMVRSGVRYDYHIDLMKGTAVIESVSLSAVCQINGFSIGHQSAVDVDGVYQYVRVVFGTEYGTKTHAMKFDMKRNMDVQYVKTLKGRFPIRINNSDQDYYTGSCTGLFICHDENNDITRDGANEHRKGIMDFLCDGTEKILRTSTGRAMIVSIDGTPSEDWSDYDGLSTVTFSWTQIGEFDITDVDPEHNPGLDANGGV